MYTHNSPEQIPALRRLSPAIASWKKETQLPGLGEGMQSSESTGPASSLRVIRTLAMPIEWTAQAARTRIRARTRDLLLYELKTEMHNFKKILPGQGPSWRVQRQGPAPLLPLLGSRPRGPAAAEAAPCAPSGGAVSA